MIFLILRNALHSLLILPYLLQLLPLLWAQIVVSDAPVDHLRVTFLQSVRTEIAVGDGFIIGVFKVRLILQFQQLEGVLVYLGSWGGGETDERALKKVPVFGKTNKKAASYCTSEQFSDGQILNLFCLTQWLR